MRLTCAHYKRLIAGVAASAALFGPIQGADARTPPQEPKPAPYPDSGDIVATARWVRAYTNLSLDHIVILTDGFVVSSQERASHETPLGRVVDLDVREEALTPRFAQTMRARSARLDVSVRCQDRRLKMNRLIFYAGADLTGRSEQSHPTVSWVNAPAGAFAGELVSAVCDPDYHRPVFAKMEDSPRSSKAPQPSARAVQPEAATAAGAPEAPASVQARRASNAPVAPQPASPQPAHTYGIDLGAYSDLSRANQLIDRLQGLRLTPEGSKYYIIFAHKNGALIYLVQLLNLESRDAADHLCSQIHDLKLDCKVQ